MICRPHQSVCQTSPDPHKRNQILHLNERRLRQHTIDATSKCFLDMLGVFAELETNHRKERQNEGILRAKQKGVYKGRKSSIDPGKIKELKVSGMGATLIAKQMGIHRDSVYIILKAR